MKKSTFCRWSQKTAILLEVIIAFSGAAFGQANYLSICNPTGACSSCCGNYTNTFNCTTTPTSGSFTVIPSINPNVLNSYSSSYFQNAVYDNAGTVLFYVDYAGIYDPTGNGMFAFSNPGTYTVTGSTCVPFGYPETYTNYYTTAGSEIVTFPVPGSCNSYYVMFWCGTSNTFSIGGSTSFPESALRVVQVTLTSSFGNTSVATSGWYNITDNILDAPVCNDGNLFYCQGEYWQNYAIAADAANADGSRDVYTLNPVLETAGGGRYPYTALLKFHFSADGSLPANYITSSEITSSPVYVPDAWGVKAKILKIGSDKYFTYVGVSASLYANALITVDITSTSHTVATYVAPNASSTGEQTVYGFEYLPSQNILCMAYEDN